MEIYIPWRDSGCGYRRKHFEFLTKHYSVIGEVVPVDSTYSLFNRANARNLCVQNSKENIVVIIDADNFINHNQIIDAIDLAKKKNKFVRPFDSVHYLNKFATERFYSDVKNFSPKKGDYEWLPPERITTENSGGAYVILKNIWEEIGGMDENFLDWGGEDTAFNIKYINFFGNQLVIPGPNYNLHHPADRVVSLSNLKLLSQYTSTRRRIEN